MADVNKQSILNKSRLDKFVLSFSIPECLRQLVTRDDRGTREKSGNTVVPDSLQYSIYGAVVPEIDVPSKVLPQFAQSLKVSSHAREPYSDVTVNFTVDNQFNNYWYIYRWLDILNDDKMASYDSDNVGTSVSLHSKYEPVQTAAEGFDENFAHANPQRVHDGIDTGPKLLQDYATDFSMFGMNEYNKKVVEFRYLQAFPTTLGEVAYNYRTPGEIESSFTFSFSQLNVNLL